VTNASRRAFKNALFEGFARAAKALSSGRRLELMDLLAQGERSVEELAQQAGLSFANASQHLQVLRAARLVAARKHGLYTRYRIANDGALRLWLALRGFAAAEMAEIDQLARTALPHRQGLEAVTMAELRERLARGGVVVIDVRPAAEYRCGHIRGAISMPLAGLARRLRQLPKRKTIVAYCRGPYCLFADEAVRLLRSRGFRAQRLEQGFPEWKLSGLPVEAGAPA
jgi:rhodanese-related sulfurtransferase